LVSDAVPDPITVSSEQLFEVLRALDVRLREHAAGLPQNEALGNLWSGLLFRIAELSLLAPLGEIGEVLHVPREVTAVPATKDWVFGIANNRGTLLPVFDLCAFLLGAPASRNVRNRVLVVRREEFPVGLLVSDVSGIRHFEGAPRTESAPRLPNTLEPHVLGSIGSKSEVYPVVSVRQMTQDARFNLTGI
jgi:twitching motility protein PilI